ncbi:RHO protein GDP dissociation inhibitor [Colletotrichum zoysiae]|uniref:Rho GDP-dissociation inhibitor n=1 Tax=Colletotrichum zoysiae TaxID=1216348 RepID=A0AAD9M089_9PEZI|nr:RHO protein GDP dissociation inhibitor [Colletotrichum zoysiae]
MASHEQEDTMPEETQGYKLSQPKQSLAEYQKMALIRDFYTCLNTVRAAHGLATYELQEEDEHQQQQQNQDKGRQEQPTNKATDENDESLQRYKESLGLGGGKDLSDASDPRVCIIQSLAMESPGRDPVIIDLSSPGSEATLKDKPFKIKEGAKFTMVANFKVQHEILSGLQYVQVVKRKGIKVSKDSEMLGSYAPNTDKQPIYTKRFQEEDAPSGMLARGHYNAISSFVDDDKKTHLTFEWSFDIAKDW